MKNLLLLLQSLSADQASCFLVELGRQNSSDQIKEYIKDQAETMPVDILVNWISWAKSRQGSAYWKDTYYELIMRERLNKG